MISLDTPDFVVVDGTQTEPDAITNRLMRAVIVSLFSWRRAKPDDVLPADQRMGWWGDIYPVVTNDRIGSRLWLLSREKLTPDIPPRAKEYAEEALQWLVEDGVAQSVAVVAERRGLDGLAIGVSVVRGAASLNLRFEDVWTYLRS